MQHAESKWRRDHCIWYNRYLVSENHDLRILTDSVHGNSTALRSNNVVISSEYDLSQQDGDSDGDMLIGCGFENGLDSKKSQLKLSMLMLDAEKFPKDY